MNKNIKQKIKDMLNNLNDYFFSLRVKRVEYKKMKDKRKVQICKKTKLTREQENEINGYYKNNYGKRINLKWHKLYQSFTGKYDKKYFPEIIFTSELEPLLNNRAIARQLSDKSMIELLYRNVKDLYIPNTILLCASGNFYDSDRSIVSKEDAKKIISNCGKKIIKITRDSCAGRGVLIIDFNNGYDKKNNLSVDGLLNLFGNNFIIQDIVTNRSDIRAFHENSLNTFRVTTYIANNNIYHTPIIMRMGRNGKEVDNAHAGGIFIGIDDNGNLLDYAYTEFKDIYDVHPDSKIRFKGTHLSGIEKIIEIAKECHKLTPHMGIVSYDFCIDEKDRIVLIEVNLSGQSTWFQQMAHGQAIFGDNTEYMLNLLKNRK